MTTNKTKDFFEYLMKTMGAGLLVISGEHVTVQGFVERLEAAQKEIWENTNNV